ncbi:uncharacterized protein K452DRAFT_24240 [Aplosporella prunicola CBS 121167]|uniref:Uncharacterized protein n=1 Tax=Aplosporella prunicola CBS 121167 TaxID=1176127 RepID=A0A6A6BCQ5_9PEZI|nr:uncharacterized protein K452DRAFT_24240 [Aplosporella prunicola CBS 121167]KAF2141979.1 hypothetical protein K452DRAFT_24240 [Aplosporella prunicola CBS 121167]
MKRRLVSIIAIAAQSHPFRTHASSMKRDDLPILHRRQRRSVEPIRPGPLSGRVGRQNGPEGPAGYAVTEGVPADLLFLVRRGRAPMCVRTPPGAPRTHVRRLVESWPAATARGLQIISAREAPVRSAVETTRGNGEGWVVKEEPRDEATADAAVVVGLRLARGEADRAALGGH